MNVLKINTSPEFEFIPRTNLTSSTFSVEIKNENNQNTQTIECEVVKLSNENYNATLASFPNGKQGDKLSYSIPNVVNGKFLIVSESESVQNYSKKNNNKFYK
jgi:hypothetical protein